ncbi:MAG: outer membrane lipoprotein carrier protein LolA, partial [Acidobacteriota bacterium]
MEKRALIFIFMVLVSMPAGRAGERETGEQVQRWLDSWTTLSGRFQQTLTSPTLPSAEVESGRFQVARPERMRWAYR